jgi:hypothetical protein
VVHPEAENGFTTIRAGGTQHLKFLLIEGGAKNGAVTAAGGKELAGCWIEDHAFRKDPPAGNVVLVESDSML